MLRMMAAAFAVMIVATTANAQDFNLALQCDGLADTDDSTFIHDQDGMAPTTVTGSKRTTERVIIMFEGESGRVRMPPMLQPMIRGRSNDGWRPLSEIVVTEDRITSRLSFNMIDKPSIRIDRVTGSIEMRGLSFRFQGECQPYDTTARRF